MSISTMIRTTLSSGAGIRDITASHTRGWGIAHRQCHEWIGMFTPVLPAPRARTSVLYKQVWTLIAIESLVP